MRFTCTRENLKHALLVTAHLSSKNITLPILNNILIKTDGGRVVFSVTNLELALRATVRAKVETEGAFTVPARVLADVVQLHEDPQFELSVNKNSELELGNGKKKAVKIKGMAADEYPIIPAIENGVRVEVDAVLLRETLGQIVFATAKNEIRPELSGVFVAASSEDGKLIFAATDSFRLAEKKMTVKQIGKSVHAIVPSRALFEVMRVLGGGLPVGEEEAKCTLVFSENQFGFEYGSTTLVTRCVEGKFPDYTQIIPAQFKTRVTLPHAELVKNIKAASLFATTGMNAVTVSVNAQNKELSVSSANAQVGEYQSNTEVEIEGEDNMIVLNHRYLLDGLGALETENVFVGLNSNSAPCLLRGVGENDYTYIIMPTKQ